MATYTEVKADCKRVSVTAIQTSATETTATYKCTVSRKNKAYYGYNNENQHLILKNAGGYYKWWGFPKKADWNSKMGTPAKSLQNGDTKTLKHGGNNVTVPSILNQKVEWTETVTIPRTESGKAGTKTIKVGVEVGPKTDSVSDTLATITLKTLATAFPAGPSLSLEYNASQGNAGSVKCNASISNWNSLFKLILEVVIYKATVGTSVIQSYEKPVNVSNFTTEYIKLAESPNGSISNLMYALNPSILKTSSKAYQDLTFRIRVTTANASISGLFSNMVTYSKTITVPSSNKPVDSTPPVTRGLHFKEAQNDYEEIEQAHLKNNNAKYLKEVWIKKDGVIHQIK